MRRFRAAVAAGVFFGSLAMGLAEVPGLLNYQGRVVVNGTNFSGTGQFKFALVDGAGGGTYWSNGVSAVSMAVSKGLFSTLLGDTNMPGMSTSVPAAVFNNSDVRLRVWFSPTGTVFQQLSPDQRLAAIGYSIIAGTVQDGAITSGKLAAGAVQSSHIAAGSIQPFHLASGAADSYENLRTRLALGADQAASFDTLQVVTTNGGSVAFTCRVGGVSLGEVEGFAGSEQISSDYSYRVSVLTENPTLNADGYVGQNAVLSFRRHGAETFFDGMVSRFGLSGFDGRKARYVLEIVPQLSRLKHTTDYGIYQDQSTSEIVGQVLSDFGITHVDATGIEGTYARREYVVQYAETAFGFFSRLLENDGLFYFFRHINGIETLVLADQNGAFLTFGEYAYFGDGASPLPPTWEYVKTFGRSSALFTGAATVRDRDFKSPALNIMGYAENTSGIGEQYEFGLSVLTAAEAGKIAGVRKARFETERHSLSGSGSCGDMKAGGVFRLHDEVGAAYDGDYLVTGVRHGGLRVATATNVTFYYGNQFEAIPALVPFRPAVRTPKPRAAGPSSAVVVGPPGQDPYVDQYGRVKVQFHWGRQSYRSGSTSVWIRVAQPSAGAQYGMSFLPGVGHEVIVDFLDGDPDRPVILGSVYNGANTQPYSLPAQKTYSTIKTRANELRFDDAAGSEEVYLKSGRDLNEAVVNNKTLTVGHDMTASVGNDAAIGSAHDMSLSGSHRLSLNSTNEVSVGAPKMTVSGDGSFNLVAPTSTASVVQRQVGELNRKTSPIAFLVVGFASSSEFNILSSYNCSAVRVTPGVYTVTFNASPANAYYAPVITPLVGPEQPVFANVIDRRRNYFTFGIAFKDGSVADKPFSVVVFGGF